MEKQRVELKSKFEKGDKPTENDYANLIDSFVHKSEDPYFKSNDLPTSSKLKAGIVEQATFEEALQTNPADINKYVSPEGIKRAIEKFAPITSVNGLTGDVTINSFTPDDTGWVNVTLENISGGTQINNQIRYRKKLGVVYLEGEVAVANSTNSNDIHLFTLNNECKPTSKKVFYLITFSGNSMAKIEVLTDGRVMYTNDTNNRAFNLSGIIYIQD